MVDTCSRSKWFILEDVYSICCTVSCFISYIFWKNHVLSIQTTKQSNLPKQRFTTSVVDIWLYGECKKIHQHALLHIRVNDCSWNHSHEGGETPTHMHSTTAAQQRSSLKPMAKGQKCCCSNCCQDLWSGKWQNQFHKCLCTPKMIDVIVSGLSWSSAVMVSGWMIKHWSPNLSGFATG